MAWSQTYFFTSMFVKPLRRQWLSAMTEVVAKSELRDETGKFLQRVPSLKSASNPHQTMVYYWYRCRATSYWARSILFVLSTPLNYLPFGIGPILYLWLHGGIKARLAAKIYAQTHGDWDRVQRMKWIAKNWHRLRPFNVIKILVSIVPLIGVFLNMVLDLAFMIWMCDEKLHHRLRATNAEQVFRAVGIADKISSCETPPPPDKPKTTTTNVPDNNILRDRQKTPSSRTPRQFIF